MSIYETKILIILVSLFPLAKPLLVQTHCCANFPVDILTVPKRKKLLAYLNINTSGDYIVSITLFST